MKFFSQIAVGLALTLNVMTATDLAAAVSQCTTSRPDLLDNPQEIRLSTDTRPLFVAETDKDRIAVLDPTTLALKTTFGSNELDGVRDIDIDARGHLYAADTHNNRVAIFDVKNKTPKFIGELKGGISRPENVAVHGNGTVYVSGAWSRNVVAFRFGKRVASIGGLSAPRALEIGRDGLIYVVVSSKRQIVVLNRGAQVSGFLGRSTIRCPQPARHPIHPKRHLGTIRSISASSQNRATQWRKSLDDW